MNPLAQWHELVKKRSMAGLGEILAEDSVFLSPVAYTPKPSKIQVIQYLTAAMALLGNDSFHYVREIIGPNDAALEFEVVLDGVQINGVDLIKWNEAGKITEFKVMLRPLKGITTVQQHMQAMLAKQNPALN